MKKLSLLLALLMILTCGILCACDKKKSEDSDEKTVSAEEKAAMAAFEAYYVNADAQAYAEIALDYKKYELMADNTSGNNDYASEIGSSSLGYLERNINNRWNSLDADNVDDIKVKSEIIYSKKYNDKNYTFHNMTDDLYNLEVKNTAVVGILLTAEYTVDGEKQTYAKVVEYDCYKIGSKWYID